MNNTVRVRLISRIMAALFILIFVSTVALSIIGITFANDAYTSEHILSYNTNSLTWNEGATDIEGNGAYNIGLFDKLASDKDDGTKQMEPGDGGSGSFRLFNTTSRPLEYTASIYMVTNVDVPIVADFPNFDPANNAIDNYALPFDIEGAQVLRVVSGKLEGYENCEFVAEWEWPFTVSPEQDIIDTEIANREDTYVSIGVMVTVTDPMAQEGVISPDPATCNCMICLFGGGCAMCWLCWTLTIIAIFVAALCAISIVLSLMYGLWWIAMIAISLLCVVGFIILLLMLLL